MSHHIRVLYKTFAGSYRGLIKKHHYGENVKRRFYRVLEISDSPTPFEKTG